MRVSTRVPEEKMSVRLIAGTALRTRIGFLAWLYFTDDPWPLDAVLPLYNMERDNLKAIVLIGVTGNTTSLGAMLSRLLSH